MAIMYGCHSLGYVLIGLVLTSLRVGADEKHPGNYNKCFLKCHAYSHSYCLLRTSSKQSKRRDLSIDLKCCSLR